LRAAVGRQPESGGPRQPYRGQRRRTGCQQASPSPGFSTLYGVTGTSANAVWAAGYGNESLVLRWNGSRWVKA
jgi:hypothetical protein